jgi:hypothetical protein
MEGLRIDFAHGRKPRKGPRSTGGLGQEFDQVIDGANAQHWTRQSQGSFHVVLDRDIYASMTGQQR